MSNSAAVTATSDFCPTDVRFSDSGTDSETDVEGESSDEAPTIDFEALNIFDTSLKINSDKAPSQIVDPHPEEPSHRATYTKPKTDGDLHIHSVLECGCEIMTCQFNEQGTLLAVGLFDGTIKVYNTDSGELVQKLGDGSSMLSEMPVTGLCFSLSAQSHNLLLATYASGTVRCWYVWGGEIVWGLREKGESGDEDCAMQRQTLCLSISPSGKQAVTGGSDSAIHLYDLTTHQRLQVCRASSDISVMDGHCLRVFAVTFHPEREREFISGGWDNTVQFWDTRQQQSVRKLSGPHVCGDALQIDPVANQILSGSWRKFNPLEVWDYDSGQKVSEVCHDPQGDSNIYTCQWWGENHMVAAGSHANMLRVIDRHSLMTESCLLGLSSPVFSSSVCPAGKWVGLIAASSGDRVYLLDRGHRAKKHAC